MSKKISYANWFPSAFKWQGIIKKVRGREVFHNQRGFKELVVVKKCGYCLQFFNYNAGSCKQCFLFNQKREGISVCSSFFEGDISHFLLFVEEMRKKSPNFEKALNKSQIVTNIIFDDCPSLDRAIQDGIIFE